MENTNNYNNSSFFLQMALPSPHHFQKGLSFLANADGLFGEEEEFDKIQPFNLSAPQSPQYHVLQRAQIVPSAHKLMPMTADAAAAAELLGYSATPLSPCFESSKQQQQNGEINAFWFSSPAPQTPPVPPARAKPYRVLQKLQYEDRPNAYLMEWRRQVSSDKVVRCQKWHREDRLLSHCRPLVQDFNRKLAEDPTLARDMTQYEVDTVLDRTLQQQQGQEVRYLVRWIGWKDPTWESRDKDLLPAYKELLDEFDTINGVAKDLEAGKGAAAAIVVESGQTAGPRANNNDEDKSSNQGQQPGVNFAPGTDWTKPVKVVRAKRVLSKLDLGKSGRPPLYLLEWPPAGAANRICEPTRANCSWEQYISLGTRDAIEKFERALAKGSSSAKSLVHHQAECIRKRKTKGRAISYQVKWVGFKPCDWLTRAQLMPTFGHLIKEFELEELKKHKNIKFSTDFTELKKREIPAELHCRLREITERAWGWKKMEDEKQKME